MLDVENIQSSLTGKAYRQFVELSFAVREITHFLLRVWTALHRGVHSAEFMFKALKDGRQGQENKHDVYCSECGLLTMARTGDQSEGPAANIFRAGVSHLPFDAFATF